jgi:hypothetical protein
VGETTRSLPAVVGVRLLRKLAPDLIHACDRWGQATSRGVGEMKLFPQHFVEHYPWEDEEWNQYWDGPPRHLSLYGEDGRELVYGLDKLIEEWSIDIDGEEEELILAGEMREPEPDATKLVLKINFHNYTTFEDGEDVGVGAEKVVYEDPKYVVIVFTEKEKDTGLPCRFWFARVLFIHPELQKDDIWPHPIGSMVTLCVESPITSVFHQPCSRHRQPLFLSVYVDDPIKQTLFYKPSVELWE